MSPPVSAGPPPAWPRPSRRCRAASITSWWRPRPTSTSAWAPGAFRIPCGLGLVPPARGDDEDEVLDRYGIRDTTYYIVVGSITARKNLGVLFDALARTPDATLVLAGPRNADAAEVLSRVDALGLNNR